MAATSIVLSRTKQVGVCFIEENCGPDTVACLILPFHDKLLELYASTLDCNFSDVLNISCAAARALRSQQCKLTTN